MRRKTGKENKTKEKRKTYLKEFLYFLLLFTTVSLPVFSLTFIAYFEPSSLNQVLFHMHMTLTQDALSASLTPIYFGLFNTFYISVICYVLTLLPFRVIRRNRKIFKVSFILIFVIAAFGICEKELKASRFLMTVFEGPSRFYQEHYQDPKEAHFSFPAHKRNLIVVFLESVENSYFDERLFGENLMPHFSTLMQENVTFNGYQAIDGTQWTIGSHVAMLCGVPLKTAVTKNSKNPEKKTFLKNLYCFPELMRDNGYITSYMKGAHLSFADTDVFLKDHGFVRLKGNESTIGHPLPDSEIGAFAGLRDRITYQNALEEIRFLNAQEKPFFFALLTLDTHFPEGFYDPQCGARKNNDFSDIVRCADTMLFTFYDDLKKEGFLDNTTVIFIGDHLTMRNDVFTKVLQNKDRQIVNAFINPLNKPLLSNRQYTAMDMAPTFLEAIGITNSKHSFGLGRSLFSEEKTLIEALPLFDVRKSLDRRSKLYQNFIEN